MRRPGAAAVAEESGWKKGEEMTLRDVNPMEMGSGQRMVVTKGSYFGHPAKIAGVVEKLEIEKGELHLWVRLQGTDSEEVLKANGLHPNQPFQVHCCPADCGLLESGDLYIHAEKGYLLKDDVVREDWMTNLEGVHPAPVDGLDELAGLRARGEAVKEPLRAEARPEKVDKGERSSSGSSRKKKAKKKKKEKKRKKDQEDKKEKKEEKHDGRSPVSSSLKKLKVLYEGTGMDPKEKVRRRLARHARRYIAKKKDKSSSSSKTSASGSSSVEETDAPPDGLFGETSKARGVHEKYPGVLFAESLKNMADNLLTVQGEDTMGDTLRPVALMYYRQELMRKCSAPVARELVNLSTALDHLARGRVAHAGDVLAQRLKAMESSLNGAHWSVSQKLEVAHPESSSIARRLELHNAQRETHLENRTKYLSSLGGGPKREERPEVKGKGKEKGPKGKDGKGRGGGDQEAAKGGKKDSK